MNAQTYTSKNVNMIIADWGGIDSGVARKVKSTYKGVLKHTSLYHTTGIGIGIIKC